MNVAITIDNKLVSLILEDFRNHPRTEGAHCFKLLLGLEEENDFGSFPLSKNEQGQLTILKDFNISLESWISLSSWIRTGLVINEHKLEQVLEVTNIFGGFPVFDTYYQGWFQNLHNKEQQQLENPMSPEEDINQKFLWRIADNKHCLGFKIISDQLEQSRVDFSFTKKWTEQGNNETILYSYIRITPKLVN